MLRSVAQAIRIATGEPTVERAMTAAAQSLVELFGLARADAWTVQGTTVRHVCHAPLDGTIDMTLASAPPSGLADIDTPTFVSRFTKGAGDLGGLAAQAAATGGAGLGIYPLLGATGRSLGALTAVHPDGDDGAREAVALFAQQLAMHLERMVLDGVATNARQRVSNAQRLTRLLTTSTEADELYGRLLDGVLALYGALRVALYIRPEESDHEILSLDDDITTWRVEARGIAGGHDAEVAFADSARIGLRMKAITDHEAGTVSWAIPMFVRSAVACVLFLQQEATPAQEASDLDDRTLLRGLVEHASLAMTSIHASNELERNHLSTIKALASALEASDQYTHDHANEVAQWTVEVGRRLGLEGKELRDLELGAIFHDIGKIAIPTEILNKPDKLTDAEFEVMKTHTVIGERIIAPLDFLAAVAPIVRHEHERWDGRGYPDGLKGSEIPLGSRIVFVCDAYHAITSTRPYRQARSHEVAREILRENAGSQFDPVVVDVFLDVVQEYFEAKAQALLDRSLPTFDIDELRDAA